MSCPFSEDVNALLMGTLDVPRRAALIVHAAGCEECGPDVELSARLTAAFVKAEPPAPILDAVMRACARPFPARSPLRWRTIGALIGIAATALLCLAYYSYGAIHRIRSENAHAAAEVDVRSMNLIVELRQDPNIRDNRSLVDALRDFPHRDGALQDGMLYDPWGSAYIVRRDGEEVALYSPGANRRDEGGLGDDIHY